jgi:hypothetical protein
MRIVACTIGVALLTLGATSSRAADSPDDTAAMPDATSSNSAAPSASGSSATIQVPDSAPDPASAKSPNYLPPVTTQVPQGWSAGAPGNDPASTWTGDPVVNYERAQNPQPYDSGIGSVSQFMMEDEDDSSPLGLAVRQDQRKLKSGEEATGLLVLAVNAGGPAAKAGVRGFQHKITTALETVTMAAAMAFPLAAPATLLVPLLESARIGEHYDMIIGVDGYRVTNVIDLQDCMRDLQPGQIVYLSMVRDGDRLQVPVKMTSLIAQQ